MNKSMKEFESMTQYDKSFDEINKTREKGLICSYFSVITAWKFMNGIKMTNLEHMNTISESYLASDVFGSQSMTYDDLISMVTDIELKNIQCTTSELLKEEVTSFCDIVPMKNGNNKNAIIILKNEKYITILVDDDGYKIRDCHESTQYNFDTHEELVEHLKSKYQFTTIIKFSDEVNYSDYSSIEYICLKNKFETHLSMFCS
jgi:hypothetical protein